jgi:hypothetical protein
VSVNLDEPVYPHCIHCDHAPELVHLDDPCDDETCPGAVPAGGAA